MQVTVEVRRDGRYWFVTVPEVEGALTQARSLSEVRSQAADAVATVLDVPIESVEVEKVTLVVDPEIEAAVREAGRLRAESAAANARAAANVRDAVRSLATAGWTLKDIGGALGVSVQRAHQLVAEAQRPDPARSASQAVAGLHEGITERRNHVIDQMVAATGKRRRRPAGVH